MSFRKQQVESVLKRTISQLLSRKISDPRITGMVSITRIELSPDFAHATVYVTVLPSDRQKMTLAGLNHASPYIHGLVCKQVVGRAVPHLAFRLDQQVKKEMATLDAIRRAVEGTGHPAGSPQEAPVDPDAPADDQPA